MKTLLVKKILEGNTISQNLKQFSHEKEITFITDSHRVFLDIPHVRTNVCWSTH